MELSGSRDVVGAKCSGLGESRTHGHVHRKLSHLHF